jgi:hypothetical protein
MLRELTRAELKFIGGGDDGSASSVGTDFGAAIGGAIGADIGGPVGAGVGGVIGGAIGGATQSTVSGMLGFSGISTDPSITDNVADVMSGMQQAADDMANAYGGGSVGNDVGDPGAPDCSGADCSESGDSGSGDSGSGDGE